MSKLGAITITLALAVIALISSAQSGASGNVALVIEPAGFKTCLLHNMRHQAIELENANAGRIVANQSGSYKLLAMNGSTVHVAVDVSNGKGTIGRYAMQGNMANCAIEKIEREKN